MIEFTLKGFSRNVLLSMVMVSGVAGCAELECAEPARILESPELMRELQEWADSRIFSGEFSDQDFVLGSLSGPGKYGDSISSPRLSLNRPDWLSGYEVRVLGTGRDIPQAVFLGKRRFQGIILSKSDLSTFVRSTKIQLEALTHVSERSALMCSTERGLSPVSF